MNIPRTALLSSAVRPFSSSQTSSLFLSSPLLPSPILLRCPSVQLLTDQSLLLLPSPPLPHPFLCTPRLSLHTLIKILRMMMIIIIIIITTTTASGAWGINIIAFPSCGLIHTICISLGYIFVLRLSSVMI